MNNNPKNTVPKSVIGAIFNNEKTKILLIKRRDVPVWVLPGGGIDEDENSECAIIREILEETGFTVKVDRLIGLYLPINNLSKPTHLFTCSIVKGEAIITEETKDVRFFDLSQLPKLIPPPFREWIFDAQENKPFKIAYLKSVNYPRLLLYFFSHPLLVLRFLFARIGLTINT